MGTTLSHEELLKLLMRGIELYNERRAPEAISELVELRGDEVVVRFTGTFCMWCGVYDWVEDLAYILRELGLEAKLVKYVEPEDLSEPYRIGVFKLTLPNPDGLET